MSAIGAGQLCQRVRIQLPIRTKDAAGAPIQIWTDWATVWADIQPISGRESRVADRIASELTHQITVRYRSDFEDPRQVAQMRVLYRGRVFAVHAAINHDEADVSIMLLVTESLADG
jgi:SPP1 family predicted phage head-tail adaptor